MTTFKCGDKIEITGMSETGRNLIGNMGVVKAVQRFCTDPIQTIIIQINKTERLYYTNQEVKAI